MQESELKKLYKKHVANKDIYRVVSNEHLPEIRKSGLTPDKNPFEKQKKDLRQFFTIIENLSRKGHVIHIKWAFETPTGTRVTKILRKDLTGNYIDLNPDKEHNNYYLDKKGGSLVSNVIDLSNELLKNKVLLSDKQIKLIKKIIRWCDKKSKYKSSTLYIKKSSKYLEKAYFQHFSGGKYWQSPFGRYNNFKKIILKHGYKKNQPYLENKKRYYLRLLNRIPVKEINKIKNT